jgi:prevent-host-death family protein
MTTKTIPAGEFKAKCLALLDEVAATGEELVVTKRGKPVARVVPAGVAGPGLRARRERALDELRKDILFIGDVLSPTGEEWEATS